MAIQLREDCQERTRSMTRSVLLGLGLVVGIDVLAIYVKYLLPRGPMMAYSHVPMVVLIGFVLMLLAGAVVARGTRRALSPSEWHTILAMGMVGAAVLFYGYSGYLISYMGAPHYFATGENEWANYLHPYIAEWLFPENEEKAVTWFWEGLPRGAQLPWGKWILPLFWWGGLTVAAFVLYACVTTIFRKQWIHYEKVAFPAMAPLVEMASNPGDGKGFLPAFTRNALFWLGFWLVFGMIAWNCVNYFIPTFPQFPIYAQGSAAHQGGRWIWIDRNFPPIYGILDIFTICFSYFATVEVLFSIWFFDLLFILEGGLLNRIGFVATSPYYYSGVCFWQTKGAFFFLVLSTIWAARSQIRDVFWKALDSQAPVDDRDEPLSYRTAVAGVGYQPDLHLGLVDPDRIRSFSGGTSDLRGDLHLFGIGENPVRYRVALCQRSRLGRMGPGKPLSGWRIHPREHPGSCTDLGRPVIQFQGILFTRSQPGRTGG